MTYTFKKSDLLSRIQPSATVASTKKTNELKAQGLNVITLGTGEPDFSTPEHIKQGAIKAIQQNKTKYTAVDGIKELKLAVQQKFLQQNNLSYQLNQITVSAGGKQVIFNAILALLNPGDEAIIIAPYWVSYLDIVALTQAKPVVVKPSTTNLQSNNLKVTAADVAEHLTDKTKLIIINSPSNPTGMMYDKHELLQLGDLLAKYPDVAVISDEIYEHLIYDAAEFYSFAEVNPHLFDRTITLNGVSKAYSMTGWRIGYAGGPPNWIQAMNTLQSQTTSNASSISQCAALTALSSDMSFLPNFLKNFDQRRLFVYHKINSIKGLSCPKPQAAFYAYVNLKKIINLKHKNGTTINNDKTFAECLLKEVHVTVIHGEAFGLSPYFRLSYATSINNLEQALNRIETFVKDLN